MSQQAEPLLGKDMSVVARLLEVMVILWRSVEKPLRQNEEAQKYTFAKFGNVMAKYFQAFEVHFPPTHCWTCIVLFFAVVLP